MVTGASLTELTVTVNSACTVSPLASAVRVIWVAEPFWLGAGWMVIVRTPLPAEIGETVMRLFGMMVWLPETALSAIRSPSASKTSAVTLRVPSSAMVWLPGELMNTGGAAEAAPAASNRPNRPLRGSQRNRLGLAGGTPRAVGC